VLKDAFRLPLPTVLGLDQRLQQIVRILLDPFAQHEAVIPRKLASVIGLPTDQTISFRDHDEFCVWFSVHRG
jgi:hypothetical protein